MQFTLSLHRDLVNQANLQNSGFLQANEQFSPFVVQVTDDYIDVLIEYLQAMALPSYAANTTSSKMINPPMIAVRLGNDVFIKGIVNGDVGVTRTGPLSEDLKY